MSDENDEIQTWIDPELEARVVAWVLGEASDFEAAELTRIIAEKPELGIFKRRIEAVHGLVAAASRLETDPMRLSEERRGKLLESLGGAKPETAVVAMPAQREAKPRRLGWKIVAGIAACLAIAAMVAGLMLPSFFSVQYGSPAAKLAELQMEKALEAANSALESKNIQIGALKGQAQVAVSQLTALNDLKAQARRSPDEYANEEYGETRSERLWQLDNGGSLPVNKFGVRVPKSTVPNPSEIKLPGAMAGHPPEEPAESDQTYNFTRSRTISAGNSAASSYGVVQGGADATGAGVPAAAPADADEVAAAAAPAPASPAAPGDADEVAARAVFRKASGVPAGGSDGSVSGAAALQQPSTPTTIGGVNTYAGGTTVTAGTLGTDLVNGNTVTTYSGRIATINTTSDASKDSNLAFNTGDGVAQAQKAQMDHVTILGDIPIFGHAVRSQPQQAQQPRAVPVQDEIAAIDQPYSTFSLHVSDVSFLLAEQALAQGTLPDPDSVRAEEFYNAFDYGDPAPGTGEKIACRIEQAAHPVFQQRNLVRIAMKVAATGRGDGQALRLTVLLDTSGSMEREDRAASVQKAMQVLTSLLGPNDAVTLIGFARQPRLLAEEVPGDQAGKLVDIVKHTPPEGGTNLEEALKAASELALRHFQPGGQNRVVMLTDGAANLGDADPEQLSKIVEKLRQQGVSFDACGVGALGLNDDILEALTRKGGGRYYFLNGPEDADEGFARQLAGAFRPAAENVKMQVRFNPDRVGKYRLIGFDKNRLKQEDFRNDKVTAAQLAAEEAGVALYQVQVLPEGQGEIGEVFVRFRDPADGRMVEQSWTIPYDPQAPMLDKASPSMQLASTAALLAEKLRGGPAADAVDLDALEPVVAQLRGAYAQQARVQDLVTMFEQVRRTTARK